MGYGRTNGSIFHGEVAKGCLAGFVGMGIGTTGTRPILIHFAAMVIEQKRTWKGLQHQVSVFITLQKTRDKVGLGNFQAPGKPLDIALCKQRAGRFAAIGALQTIGALKGLFMRPVDALIEVSGRRF